MSIQINGSTGIKLPSTPAVTDSSSTVVDSAFVQNLFNQYGSYAGHRNMVINGDMRVAQRATSMALTSTIASYGSLDRWGAGQNGTANGIFAQVAVGPSGQLQWAAKLGRNSGATNTSDLYAITAFETSNSIPFQGQTMTLSFYAKAGANYSGVVFTGQVQIGTGTDQSMSTITSWNGVATAFSTNATLTTSWQRFTVTGLIPTNATQLAVFFHWTPTGTAGADDNVYITGVQLEPGNQATPFEYRPYGTELALCQRYFNNSLTGVPLVRSVSSAVSGNYSGGVTCINFPYMRSNISMVLNFSSGNVNNPVFNLWQNCAYIWFITGTTAVGDYSIFNAVLSAEL